MLAKIISLKKSDLPQINSYLFGLYGLFISLSVSITSVLSALIFVLLLIDGGFKRLFLDIKHNIFIYAVVLFVALHFLGLLWTEDFAWAFKTLNREWKLLFIVLFMMVVKKKDIYLYLKLFLIGMTISEVASYLIFFEIIPPFMHATVYMPNPFIRHFSYTVYLAAAISVFLYFIFFSDKIEHKERLWMFFFMVTMTINIFINGGRAGQIAFFIMTIVMAFFIFKKSIKVAFSIIFALVLSIIIAYNSSNIFYDRIHIGISDISNFKTNNNTSLGIRMSLAINSWEIIKRNPIIGVGTGDTLLEYKKVNDVSQYKTAIMHPHNMYILLLIEFGVVGLASLLFLFYAKVKIALSIEDNLKSYRFAFLIMFAAILFSNSFLYTHHTMVLYVFFSSFLFKEPSHT